MRIEEGKYYRTRDGRKVGPAKKYPYRGRFEFDGEHPYCHDPDGKYLGRDSSLDLISEWTEGPVRTVTRQEIIPGTYDGVSVKGYASPEWVTLEIGEQRMTADDLTRAAAVLTALAGALRDGE